MTWRVIFSDGAESDVLDAVASYDKQRAGLGDAMLAAVDDAVARIAESPYSFKRVYDELRRARVGRLPYAIFIRLRRDIVEVVAIMHTSRDPRRWQAHG